MSQTTSTEKRVRRALYFCGIWNVVGGVTALANPSKHLARMDAGSLTMADPVQSFFFRATWTNGIA